MIRRLLDILVAATGFVFGFRAADQSHKKNHAEAVEDARIKNKKSIDEINRYYNGVYESLDVHELSEKNQLPTDKT